MSDAKGNQEPSMEEILASIRRIISEDGEPKEDPAPAPAAVNGHAAAEEEGEDDALVLTDMVVGDSSVVELKEEAPRPAAPPPVLEAPPTPVQAPAPMPETKQEIPEPELERIEPERPAPAAAMPIADTSEGKLVSPDVEAASAAAMAQLMAHRAHVPQQRSPASLDGLLVETLVRQAVEPMLKGWLDEHLQDIVERLVRREVERLSRKAELS